MAKEVFFWDWCSLYQNTIALWFVTALRNSLKAGIFYLINYTKYLTENAVSARSFIPVWFPTKLFLSLNRTLKYHCHRTRDCVIKMYFGKPIMNIWSELPRECSTNMELRVKKVNWISSRSFFWSTELFRESVSIKPI